ncbi:metal-dependent hydrolase [Bacillus wiedmannii]|uniref:metal-dependent hydrolase n=1 Tax=Bacillus wiedmannii TaxID=1890302 RepID=UPI0027B9F9CB|nr:metal-dependent hydrolase [Bacillus wiedmannii]
MHVAAFALIAHNDAKIGDNPYLLTVTSIVGALMPDICHQGSTLGRKVPLLYWGIHKTFGHRTITHSLIFLFGISALLWYLVSQYPIIYKGMFTGGLSHLVLDARTPSGI